MFSWEAFSTLMTGIAAVCAAAWVGWNQLQLQKRQTQLIEDDLKIQLLERRAACVSDMREIYWAYMRNAKFSEDEMFKFHKLLEQAELLFPPKVSSKLDEAIKAAFWSERHYRRALDLQNTGENAKADEKLELHFSLDDKVFQLLPELLHDLVLHTRVDAWG